MMIGKLSGSSSQLVDINAQLSVSDNEFNEMGIFEVDGPNGAVGGVLPSSSEYGAAVFASSKRQVLYSQFDVQAFSRQATFPGGAYLAVYVLQPTSKDSDAAAHIRVKPNGAGGSRIGWEKSLSTTGWPEVGDRGFDDSVVALTYGAPYDGNAAPVITNIPRQAINELSALSILPIVRDADMPGDSLTFSFVSAPPGMTIDRITGRINWTPTEAQGPGTYTVVLKATDLLGASDTETFDVAVGEVNLAPTITPIADKDISFGNSLAVTATAADQDLPKNNLQFSFVGAVPAGATIDATTGAIRWTPTAAQDRQGYDFTVKVSDSATPALSASTSFFVGVGDCAFAPELTTVTNHQLGGSGAGQGGVSTQRCVARLTEGNSFEVAVEAEFVVPAQPAYLQFDRRDLVFDSQADFVNDAFEAALVDVTGEPLVQRVPGSSNAFYNVTEGQAALIGSNTKVNGNLVQVDLSHIVPGTRARLILRLVNNDADAASTVSIAGVQLVSGSLGTPASITATSEGGRIQLSDAVVSGLSDVTASTKAEYELTSYDPSAQILQTDLRIRNTGTYEIRGPIVVAVDHISDPTVSLIDADGRTSTGLQYVIASSTNVNGTLASNESTGARRLFFRNPSGKQFTFDVVVLGQLNRAPVFTSVAPTEAVVGRTYTYTMAATDADSDTLTYKKVIGPSITLNGSTLTWSPTANDKGSQSFSMMVSDGRGGLTTQAFVVNVTDPLPNRPPVFTSTPIVDAFVGSAYNYQATAVDADGNALTYSVIRGPIGLTVDRSSGQVSWNPTSAQLGQSTVELKVDDGNGGSALQTFTIAVHPTIGNDAPHIISQPITNYTPPSVGQALSSGSFVFGDIFTAAGAGKINRYSSDGVLLQTLDASSLDANASTSGMAFDAFGNLYVASIDGNYVAKFDSTGKLLGRFGGGYSGPESIVIDRAGNVYVSSVGASPVGIRKFDAEGKFLATLLPGTRVDWMELAADQNTLFFTQEGTRVRTVSLKTGQAGADFVSGNGVVNAFALRVLPTGGLLLANRDNVLRFNSNGTLIQTYTVPGETGFLFSLNINPDGKTFWTASLGEPGTGPVSGKAYKINIQSGAIEQELDMGVRVMDVGALTVFGERTVGSTPITPYRYPVEAIDPDNDTLRYTLVDNPDGMTIDPTTGVITWAGPNVASKSVSAFPSNGMTLSPAGAAAGFVLSEFVKNVPLAAGLAGPLGIAVQPDGSVLVSEYGGEVRRYATNADGQDASTVPATASYGFGRAFDMAQNGSRIYMTQRDAGAIVELNSDGTFKQTIVSGLSSPHGIVVNLTNGHLLVVANGVYDVDPVARTATFLFNASLDGIAIAPDAKVLYGASFNGHIYGFSLVPGSVGNIVFDSGFVPGGPDGTGVGAGAWLVR